MFIFLRDDYEDVWILTKSDCPFSERSSRWALDMRMEDGTNTFGTSLISSGLDSGLGSGGFLFSDLLITGLKETSLSVGVIVSGDLGINFGNDSSEVLDVEATGSLAAT